MLNVKKYSFITSKELLQSLNALNWPELILCLNLCLRDKKSENELMPQGNSHLVEFLLQTEIPTLKRKLQKHTKIYRLSIYMSGTEEMLTLCLLEVLENKNIN